MDKITTSFVFQTDSDIVRKALNEPNYLIEYSETNQNSEYCIIYFSSNNIYFPNTEAVFHDTIIKKNKYEWYGTRIKKGAKHIFIRDIQKQWYLNGINSEINTVEKLTDFLKKETEGYKTIMVGSSAGGYAAVLLGSLLNSEFVLSFNGQFQIYDLLETSNEAIDPIIFREKNNSAINQYFSLKKLIYIPSIIYYFYSNKSSWDLTNKRHVENIDINIISFNTSNHGIPFLRSALPFVLNTSIKKLNSWNKRIFNPILFSIKYGGLFATFNMLYKKLIIK